MNRKTLQHYLSLFKHSKTKEEAKKRLINSGIIDSDGNLNPNYYVSLGQGSTF